GILVTDHEQLVGIVTVSDLERALASGQTEATVGDMCTRNLVTAYPDETLDDALHRFGALDVGRMPVVDRRDSRRVLGMLRRGDIIHALSGKILETRQSEQNTDRLKMEAALQTGLKEHFLRGTDWACGKLIKEIPLPENCVIVSIQRGKQIVVPRGSTALQTGDRIIALVGQGAEDAFQKALQEHPPAPEEKPADHPTQPVEEDL
ncbi:MAG TPA: CBS domain-containing protein, partial [Anaerolineaceae bacterium]